MRSQKRRKNEPKKGCVLALAIAAIPVVGSILVAGPDTVWQNLQAVIGRYPPPHVLRVLAAGKDHPIGTFLVTIQNPSDRQVIITGYRVSPSSTQPSAAATNTIGANVEQIEGGDEPEPCSTGKRTQPFSLPNRFHHMPR